MTAYPYVLARRGLMQSSCPDTWLWYDAWHFWNPSGYVFEKQALEERCAATMLEF